MYGWISEYTDTWTGDWLDLYHHFAVTIRCTIAHEGMERKGQIPEGSQRNK